jgi:hypothetical protein
MPCDHLTCCRNIQLKGSTSFAQRSVKETCPRSKEDELRSKLNEPIFPVDTNRLSSILLYRQENRWRGPRQRPRRRHPTGADTGSKRSRCDCPRAAGRGADAGDQREALPGRVTALTDGGAAADRVGAGGGRDAELFVRHLEDLRRRLRRYRKVHVICDNARAHDCRAVREYLGRRGHRIEVHYLPTYAPDANPRVAGERDPLQRRGFRVSQAPGRSTHFRRR